MCVLDTLRGTSNLSFAFNVLGLKKGKFDSIYEIYHL